MVQGRVQSSDPKAARDMRTEVSNAKSRLRLMAGQCRANPAPILNDRKACCGGEPPDVVMARRRLVFHDAVSEETSLGNNRSSGTFVHNTLYSSIFTSLNVPDREC